LKNLRKLLRDSKHEEDEDFVETATNEISNIMKDLSCSEAALQAFDLLLASKHTKPQYVLAAIDAVLENEENGI
jgi:hypothetical protein